MFDWWDYPYVSGRMPVMAKNIVATSQPLAAQAGLQMLLRGGNAVDAALAAAIALTVVEPTSNGIGSDAFAMIWDGKQLHGVNGSGCAPMGWSPVYFSELKEMPKLGWDSVTVPGAVGLWAALSRKFGCLPFEELFEAAILYASEGFLVSPRTAQQWSRATEIYKDFPSFAQAFLPNGRAPQAGELFSLPDQADSLEEIAVSWGKSFYQGHLSYAILEHASKEGAAIQDSDFASHEHEWVRPIPIEYRGVELFELPPNGQGLAALIALGILRQFDMASYEPDSVDSLHLQIEAMKIALAIAYRHIADATTMQVSVKDTLNDNFLKSCACQLQMDHASPAGEFPPVDQGTVYLTTADASGMMVSFIQSNYCGFGSGIVVPGTGISLQNRGYGFSLKEGHPNRVGGGKRPFHTIIPGFVMKQGKPLMSFGVMGGPMQPQGHVQMMVRLFDYHQNPQAACDAPRWFLHQNGTVELESGFSQSTIEGLQERGHNVVANAAMERFGGAQLIYKVANGYVAASDHRKDGHAVGF